MNKQAYADLLATKFDLTKKQAREIVDTMFEATVDTLKAGKDISVIGFGSLKIKNVAARPGHNPQTGKTIEIPAHKEIHFKAGKTLKDAINK